MATPQFAQGNNPNEMARIFEQLFWISVSLSCFHGRNIGVGGRVFWLADCRSASLQEGSMDVMIYISLTIGTAIIIAVVTEIFTD